MPVQPGVEYEGECTGGSWIRSQNGNPGFQIFLKCKDGTASYTIWLAGKDREKAKTRAAKNLRILGCSDTEMKSSTFLNYQLPQIIVGKLLRFGTVEEEYENRKHTKVIWIGTKRKESDVNAGAEAASFFGAEPTNGDHPDMPPAEDSEDIPF